MKRSPVRRYLLLLRTVIHIEQQDAQFLSTVMELAAAKDIDEREISSLLMANRLFSQSCRLQIFALKDLLLRKEEIKEFDHAMDMKELLDEEHGRQGIDPPQPNAPENRQIA